MPDASAREILIVDDNHAFAENLSETLQEAGYRVRRAASGAEAVLQTAGFCVALVEVQLPDGDGTAVASQLKERWPASEVILLTGSATVESATAAVRAGAWAYLVKSGARDELLHTLQQAVRHVVQRAEQRQLARRAQVAEKLAAVGTLAAGLSHEIRNPLNGASLQLTVLERRMRRLPSEVQPSLLEPIALVQQEIRRLGDIVEDFLQFARPREFIPVAVELQGVVISALAQLAAPAEQAGLRIECELTPTRSINGDASRLLQVVLHLVRNAIQATPAGGWVLVVVADLADEVQLLVEDSGPGVPAVMRRHLFEPFFTTKESGSGLGLPLVHSIVEQHAGSVHFEEGKVGGARFVVRIPARPE